MNNKVALRFKLLQSEIEEINKCYNNTLRDSYADSGMEYNKPVPYNEESILMFNQLLEKGETLQKQREEDLFGKLFHFSQTFFSIKDYLKKIYPQYEGIIEDFFSIEKIDGITRKKICNDLKHNPPNDLVLKRPEPEITLLPTGRIIKVSNQKKWFYVGKDSVEYCNKLFNDLSFFLKENNF